LESFARRPRIAAAVTDRWPLPTGLGGVVGDAILSLPRHATGGNRLVVAIVG